MAYRGQNAVLGEVSGGAVYFSLGVATRSFVGKTTIQMTPTRLIEKTRKMIARRHCEIPISEVDSIEILEAGNSIWILLGIFTLFIYGLGIIFFIIYFFQREKFFIIRSRSNAHILTIEGADGMDKCREFMERVLSTAEELKKSSS
jgi:hypothetical protein